ncbi:MAG: choice-of-anchor tandem repeat GloVer-containing protein, partial [Terriglobales bacterium]
MNAPYGCGTVFKITAGGTLTTLYRFKITDGNFPYAGLVQATDGNFYGTTQFGGDLTCNAPYGCGTVFKITAGGTLTTLYSFEGTDGAVPLATLVQATDGNFYGTTEYGGTSGNCGADRCGTIFKITPAGTLTMLHSFDDTDGSAPYGALIQATDGNFYGTTEGGNSGGHYDVYGTVFSLTGPGPQLIPTTTVLMTAPNPSNLGQPVTMTATVTAQDGSLPTGTVVFESNGVQIGSASLNGSGVAVLVYAGLSAGTDSLTAVYQGSGTLAGSTSNTVPQVVQPVRSMTTVTSSPNPSTFGEAVTITATVSPSGPPAPTGTVSFTSNGSAISGCTAVPLGSSLTAVCMTSTLAVGTDAIVATYSGDTNYSGSSGGLSQLVNPTPSPLQFVAVTPCRLVDTRPDRGGSGPILGGTFQSFPIPQEGGCNIPTSAAAYSLNVSVVPQGQLGYLTIWPTGQGQPVVATLNSLDGRIKADAAIVPAGDQGAISIYVTNTTNVVLDINGYFAPASGSTLPFYPLPPCRVADTRHSTYPPGLGPPYLTGHAERQFPILNATSCNIPSNAAAYSLNFSVVPHGGLGYLTVWPPRQTRPLVSTLNDLPGTIIANAALVPAGTGGDVSVYPSSDTDLVIDINGYFAPAGTGGLSLYPVAPCRVIDTRKTNCPPGLGAPYLPGHTERDFPILNATTCNIPPSAQAYSLNFSVVP